jgi:hypothetical protein
MVLDGAIDPSLAPQDALAEQAVAFEHALERFLDACARDTDCEFRAGGDPHRGFERLMAAIDAEPMYARVDGEERSLGPGEAEIGVAQALYGGRDGWPDLAAALAAALRGDGSLLLELSDRYTDRAAGGGYSNQTEAFYAISCLDARRFTAAEVRRQGDALAQRAPAFGEASAWLSLPCSYWRAEPDVATGPFAAPGAPTLLVLGTTNDPATPYPWARSLARQLDARLVTLDDDGHAAYGRGNDCVDDLVHDYLLDLTVPPDGTEC